MSLNMASDRIHVTNAAGQTVFDTNRRMFAITNLLTGTVSIADKPSNNNRMQRATTVLGSINSEADFVMGQVKAVSAPAGGGLPNVGVFSAGGTIVWGWYREDVQRTMRGLWTITFRAVSGQLLLEEEWWNQNSGTHPSLNLTLVGGTLSYRIHAGTFI
ncbi:hypothetical protein [Skermanella stibiiresistens]|nr:hypothetical protein [Skermanella stibiiresistens]